MPTARRPFIKAIGGVATAATLAGCITGGSDEAGAEVGSDDLRMWTSLTDAEESDLESFIEQFEAQHDYSIHREEVGELDDQLETAMPAGDGPDLWPWAHDWVGRFAIRDDPPFLYDASDDLTVDLDVYSGAAKEAVQFDGGVYGLPNSAETVSLFYNEDMIDEPPETLDELVSIMDRFHDPESGEYGLSYPATDPYFASGFLQAFGGSLYDEANTEVTLDSGECVEGLEVLQTLFDYIPADPGYESQVVVFADELAPFAINGPWELGNFDEEVDGVGVTELPIVEGNHPRSFSGIQMWYFSAELADADSTARDAAVEWAEWYTTTREVSLTNADNHGAIPVHTDHAEAGSLSDEVQAFSRQVDHGMPIPTHPDMDSVWGPTEDALSRVFNGDQEPKAALEQAATEIRDRL